MKIFDLKNPGQQFTEAQKESEDSINETFLPEGNNVFKQVVEKKEGQQVPPSENRYSFGAAQSNVDGVFLNRSDSELIRDSLEKYLPTASLRLEMQIGRLSKEIDNIQRELKALSMLENSDLKLRQQKLLLAKRQHVNAQLNKYKEEYRNISPVHRFALWLKDSMKKSTSLSDPLIKLLYGNQAGLLISLREANMSLNLLVDKAQSRQIPLSTEDGEQNIYDIVKQFEKIESDIEKVKQNYYEKQGPGLGVKAIRLFQRLYYGYELPEKNTPEAK